MRARLIDSLLRFDERSVRYVVAARGAGLTEFFRVFTVTAWGGCWALYVVVLTIALYLGPRPPAPLLATLLKAVVAPGAAWFFVAGLKRIFRRPRPFQMIADCPALSWSSVDDSFPSGHAASSFAFLAAMAMMYDDFSMLAGIAAWAVLVTFSRLYLGLHYVSDLLGGILIGSVVGTVWGKIAILYIG